jgi:hypothetical protein
MLENFLILKYNIKDKYIIKILDFLIDGESIRELFLRKLKK